MNDTLVGIVKAYSQEIENGRAPVDILVHLKSEVLELQEEIEKKMEGLAPGDDGISGEAIDIVLLNIWLITVIPSMAQKRCTKKHM